VNVRRILGQSGERGADQVPGMASVFDRTFTLLRRPKTPTMSIQPVDIPSLLLRSAAWPIIVLVALVIFRRQLPELVRILSRQINKFTFAGLSLELTVVSEMQSTALEIEVRQFNAAPQIQSGVSSISGVFEELKRTGHLASGQVTRLMGKSLELIRLQLSGSPAHAAEWTSLNNEVSPRQRPSRVGHKKMGGPRRLLGES
jgi:hypothetical protein